jgi:serine/threonine-protein kinase
VLISSPRQAPPIPESALVLPIGKVLGDTFELLSVLGAGGMGLVYEAHDRKLNRRVAIKVAWPTTPGGMLAKEAQALAAIRHTCVVGVYHMGVEHGLDYLVMERLHGMSLRMHLDQRKRTGHRFSVEEILDVMVLLADGLAAVHREGIAHRDVKPDNIMLAPGNRLVLMDFGLFHFEANQHRPEVSGSPDYMAPEVILHRLQPGRAHAVDLYAMGVIACEMLLGELPFPGESIAEVMKSHLMGNLPNLDAARPDAPPDMLALVRDLVAKSAQERPPSAESVLWQLRAIGLGFERTKARPQAELGVLVVEDDPAMADMLKVFIRDALPASRIAVASTGEAALAAVRSKVPDVMCLDLGLPDMSGVEILMYLRGTRVASRCAMVAVSGTASDDDRKLLEQLGIFRFVPKDQHLGGTLRAVMNEIARTRR